MLLAVGLSFNYFVENVHCCNVEERTSREQHCQPCYRELGLIQQLHRKDDKYNSAVEPV